MKTIKSAISLLLLSSVSAFAADLPSIKSAPAAAPALMWMGFYAGLNAGYTWGTNSNAYSSFWNAGSWKVNDTGAGLGLYTGASFTGGIIGASQQLMTLSGFIGGGQFGYNYQGFFNPNIVIGFEADIQGTTANGGQLSNGVFGGQTSDNYANNLINGVGTGTQSGYALTSVSAELDYLGTARGRIGYLWSPTFLLYGTAGLAFGGARANISTTAASNVSVTDTSNITGSTIPSVSQMYWGRGISNSLLVGYSVGGGLEWMFVPNWSLKGEALYYSLGNMNVSNVAATSAILGQNEPRWAAQAYSGTGLIAGQTSINYQGIIARAGVNYHFNFANVAPVVAKF